MVTDGDIPAFMSPQQLADYVGVPLATVYRWNTRGGGPAIHRLGGHVRYSKADIKKWLAGSHETKTPVTPLNAQTPRVRSSRRSA